MAQSRHSDILHETRLKAKNAPVSQCPQEATRAQEGSSEAKRLWRFLQLSAEAQEVRRGRGLGRK